MEFKLGVSGGSREGIPGITSDRNLIRIPSLIAGEIPEAISGVITWGISEGIPNGFPRWTGGRNSRGISEGVLYNFLVESEEFLEEFEVDFLENSWKKHRKNYLRNSCFNFWKYS